MKKYVAGTALALVLSVAGATAATVSSSASTGLVQTDFNSPGLGIPGLALLPAIELDYFDGSLGTLTGVELTVDAEFETKGSVANTASTVAFTGVTQSVNVNVLPSALTPGVSIDLSDGIAPQLFTVGQSVDVAFSDTGSSSQMLANVGDFVGTGNFDLDFITGSATTIGGGGNIAATLETFAKISATVVYTFDPVVVAPPPPAPTPTPAPVPLPAGGWLLLAGLGALGVAKRRQRG